MNGCSSSTPPTAGQSETRSGFMNAKRHANIGVVHAAADKRCPEAQAADGSCLCSGYTVSQDKRQAARYFKIAADQGDSGGQVEYGCWPQCLSRQSRNLMSQEK